MSHFARKEGKGKAPNNPMQYVTHSRVLVKSEHLGTHAHSQLGKQGAEDPQKATTPSREEQDQASPKIQGEAMLPSQLLPLSAQCRLPTT